MVTEQIIFETDADMQVTYNRAIESRHVRNYKSSRKGLLALRLKANNTEVQVTSKGILMIFWDRSQPEAAWKGIWWILKRVLRTQENRPVTKVKWSRRFDHITRLESLRAIAETQGTIESQLSVSDELKRLRKQEQKDTKRPSV